MARYTRNSFINRDQGAPAQACPRLPPAVICARKGAQGWAGSPRPTTPRPTTPRPAAAERAASVRLLRAAGATLAALSLLALLAAWLGPGLLDWDRYRGTLAGMASAGLGRPVRINGPVSLVLLPQPVLVAAEVTVADTGDGASAEVRQMRLQVGLAPLLAGRLEPQDLVLRSARLRLPWPPRPGAWRQRPPDWLAGLHARVEDGTLLVGGLAFSAIEAALAADPLTGTLSATAAATALGQRWDGTARLGRAGHDGVAPLELSLDGQGAVRGTGGALSGQVAGDGALSGQVSGHGRDLSRFIAGPASPWRAAGRFRGVDGLALADELDVEIGGAPARGAVALRLLPAARVDAALSASRLDLDAWLPGLLQGGAALPASVDLSSEAATLAGGALRRFHAAFDLAPDGVTLRDAEAVLPGDADLALAGRLAGGRFTGTGRIAAPALRETLRWLRPAYALPPGALQAATLAGDVTLADGRLALRGLKGAIDGAAATGMLALLLGERPSLTARLALDAPVLDPWLPDLPADPQGLAAVLAAWPGRWGGFDADIAIAATRPRWRGAALDRLDLDASLQGGTLTVRRAAIAGPGVAASLAGALSPGGQVADGRFGLRLAHASAERLPPGWPSGLLHGPAALQASASGRPGALSLAAHGELAGLQADAGGIADLARPAWTGSLALRHQDASRLLEALGHPAPWLGDGSFSLAATVALDPARLALGGLAVSAGALRAGGDLALDRGEIPTLTGRLDAGTLPLPLPAARSPEPLPLDWLHGWRARLKVTAGRLLLGLSPAIGHVAASVALEDGALRVTDLSGEFAGGRLTGQAALDAAAPPHLSLQGSLSGATLPGPLLGGALDLAGGRLDAAVALAATGFSPGAMLATLEGSAQATLRDGVLAGLDVQGVDDALGRANAASAQAGVAAALAGGATAFTRLDAAVTVQHGVARVRQAALEAPGGHASLTGTLDLPIDSADLQLTLAPAWPEAPAIGMRLIGPVAAPRRAPELAALAGWLAGR